LHRDPVFLLEPGDAIEFVSIDAAQFAEMDHAAQNGEPVAELVAA